MIRNKIILVVLLYICTILFNINDNSNIEVLIKIGIISMVVLQLNSIESKKIFFTFYIIISIFLLLFFIQYILSDTESAKHLANILFILLNLLLPMYIIVSLNLVVNRYFKEFIKYNIIYFITIFIFFFKDIFGFETGIANMTYTQFDIFLFVLTVIQILFAIYFSKLILLIFKRKVSSENYFKNKR